jgi:hypothetical protein
MAEADLELPDRPRTRADCIDGPRPCPWYGCRYHLGIKIRSSAELFHERAARARELSARCRLPLVASILVTEFDVSPRQARRYIAGTLGEAEGPDEVQVLIDPDDDCEGRDTCALDFVDRNPQGGTVRQVAAVLGIDVKDAFEEIRAAVERAGEALGARAPTKRKDPGKDA